jgi:hypothetical protein
MERELGVSHISDAMLLQTLNHFVAPCMQGLHYGDKYSSPVLRLPSEAGGRHHGKRSAYFPLFIPPRDQSYHIL